MRRCQQPQRLRRMARMLHLQPVRLQQRGGDAREFLVVLDQQHPLAHQAGDGRGGVLLQRFVRKRRRQARMAGSSSDTVVPSPGVLARRAVPPDCTHRPSTWLRPSPVPLPTGLVVKKGSNTRSAVCGSMPQPSSPTVIST